MLTGSVGQPAASRHGLGSAVGLKNWVCWPCATAANVATTALAMSTRPARPARDILALPAENEEFVLIGTAVFNRNVAQERRPQARSRQATETGRRCAPVHA